MRWIAWALVLGACKADGEDADVVCAPQELSISWTDDTTGFESWDLDHEVPWTGETRTIPINLWYPTADTSGEAAMYNGVFEDPRALDGAAFADPQPGCKLPVVVYSHGSQAWGGANAQLLRHLVSQGWVAVAPDHTDNTIFQNIDPKPVGYSLLRAVDIQRTLDALEDLPAEHPLAGRLDTSRVLMAGHSYGGQTSWFLTGPAFNQEGIDRMCASNPLGCTEAERAAFDAPVDEPRVAAAMPLDGDAGEDWFVAEAWNEVEVPIFAQSQVGGGASAMFERARGAADLTWVSLTGSCHETFNGSPITCDTFDKTEGFQIVGTYFTAFAAHYILGDERAEVTELLEGTTVLDARVTLVNNH